MKGKKITFDELHRLVSEIDYINEKSYPVSFKVDGIMYRAGIGYFNDDDSDRSDVNIDGIDFTDFFYGFKDEIQYFSIIENFDEDATFKYEDTCGYDRILDAQDPDVMEFDEIGEMLIKHCDITETSVIELYEEYSFNGKQYDVFWMALDQEVIDKEQENIKNWKAEMEREAV